MIHVAITENGEAVDVTDAFTHGEATFIRESGTNTGFVWLPDGWTLTGDVAPELQSYEIIERFMTLDGRCYAGDDAFNFFVEHLN